jgi:hypothetical protein
MTIHGTAVWAADADGFGMTVGLLVDSTRHANQHLRFLPMAETGVLRGWHGGIEIHVNFTHVVTEQDCPSPAFSDVLAFPIARRCGI